MMKKVSIITLSVFNAALSAFSQDSGVQVESAIDSVTIYPDSAMVSRVFEVDLPVGIQQLEIGALPASILGNSLQASVIASSGPVLVRDVRLVRDDSWQESPELKVLRDEIARVRGILTELDAQAGVWKRHVDFAEEMARSFAAGYGSRESRMPTVEEAQNTWAYLEAITVGAQNAFRDQEREREKLNEELKALDKKLNERIAKARLLTNRARLTVDASTAGRASLQLKYLMTRASWSPVYEVRAYPSRSEIELVAHGEIQQAGGEDWSNVALRLSTSRAARSGDVPVLRPIRLFRMEPVSTRSAPMMQRSLKSMEDGMGMADMAMEAPPVPMEAVVEQGFTAFEILVPHRMTVASGTEAVRAPLQRRMSSAELWTEVVASQSTDGYLRASMLQNLDMPVLPGRGILFVDDKLVGQASLGRVLPGEEIKLSLGVDESIVVTRKDGRSRESQSGLIDKTTTQMRQYLSTIKNSRPKPHAIVFKDQFPLSENERIVVRRHVPAEKDVPVEPNTGIFEIKRVLNPGEEATFETRFEVVYPRDWDIPVSF